MVGRAIKNSTTAAGILVAAREITSRKSSTEAEGSHAVIIEEAIRKIKALKRV